MDAVTEQIKENYGETTDSEHGSTISPATNAIDEIQEKVGNFCIIASCNDIHMHT